MIRKVNEKSIWAQIEIQEILVRDEKRNHTVKVNEYWRMLPRDVLESPSLRMAKFQLDTALNSLL